MDLFGGKATLKQLQWLVWIAVLLIIFFTLLPEDGFYEAGIFSVINVCFYVAVIYGNISFLFPRFYLTGKQVQYGVFAFIFVVSAGLGRGFLVHTIYNNYFATTYAPITTR